MPRVVFSGNRLEQWQLYLAFGGISWAIWGSQSSNRRAASPEKSWLVPALLLLTYLKSCQESLCCSSWLLDKTRECCGEQPHRLSMLIHFSRKQNISGSQMQIYSLESCGTIRKKRKKNTFILTEFTATSTFGFLITGKWAWQVLAVIMMLN